MSFNGSYQDHQRNMYKGVLELQAQQMGSRLTPTVRQEPMAGDKTFFDKTGKVTHNVKDTRNQDRIFQDQSYERRQVQGVLVEYATYFDREDLIKYIQNPLSEVTQSAVAELARVRDSVIYSAIKDTATVTANNATTEVALTLSVAVDDNTYDNGSGDLPLTTSKLKVAIAKMRAAYGIRGNERVFCVGPTDQLMNLTTENQQVSSDFRAKKPLEGPGTIEGLSGFLGIDFVAYDEEIAVDGSGDEKIFLYTHSAIRLGVFLPLTVEVDKSINKMASPDQLAVFEKIGATRMYEEKVCVILCDPILI